MPSGSGSNGIHSGMAQTVSVFHLPAQAEWKDMSMIDREEKAKELLASAGYGPDNPLNLTIQYNTSEDHKKLAIAVQQLRSQRDWRGGGGRN